MPTGVVLAGAGYGNNSEFRAQLTEWDLPNVAGLMRTVKVWNPGSNPHPLVHEKSLGRPPKLLRRDLKHQPVQ